MGERAMPAPDCIGQGELDPGAIDFGRLGRRVVEGRLDGGSRTRDGEVMLPSAADQQLKLIEVASRCIADPRSALRITHAVRDMLRQRVHGLALGWDDLDDHKALRCNVAMQTAVGVDREAPANPRWAGWRTGPAVLRMCGCWCADCADCANQRQSAPISANSQSSTKRLASGRTSDTRSRGWSRADRAAT